MKKILILLIIVFCVVLCACNDENVPDGHSSLQQSKGDLKVEGGADINQKPTESSESFESENRDSENVDNIEAIKSDLTDGAQNEMSNGNVSDEKTEENIKIECTCNCQCSKNGIDLGDALLIAQNHLFAMRPPEFSLDIVYSAWYLSDNEETWTILIGEDDVNPNDEYDYNVKGGGYTYVINKATGKILEIRSGE